MPGFDRSLKRPLSLEKWTFLSAMGVDTLQSWLDDKYEPPPAAIYPSMISFLRCLLGDAGKFMDRAIPNALEDCTMYGAILAVWGFFDLPDTSGIEERAEHLQVFLKTIESLRDNLPHEQIRREDAEALRDFLRHIGRQGERDAAHEFHLSDPIYGC